MKDRYVVRSTSGYKGSMVRRKKLASAQWMVLDSAYCYRLVYSSDMPGAEERAHRLCGHLNEGGRYDDSKRGRQALFRRLRGVAGEGAPRKAVYGRAGGEG